MRPLPLVLSSLLLLPACGGSSSETPWPAEPQGPALGPDDEAPPPGMATPPPAPQTPRAPENEGGDGAPAEPRDQRP